MTITIETNKRGFINALVALCKAAGISKVSVTDEQAREDEGLYLAMQEADRTDTVPTDAFIAKLRAKAATK